MITMHARPTKKDGQRDEHHGNATIRTNERIAR